MIRFYLFLLFLCTSNLLMAQDETINHNGRKALFELEVEFSNAAKQIGFISANTKYAAADAIVFRPLEINAKEWSRLNSIKEFARKNNISDIGEWMKKNNVKDTIMVVQWTPSFVDVSLAGDLGYATGPFENYSVNPVGHGQFVTVWSKQQDGKFKFIMDFGSNLLPSGSAFVKELAFQPAGSHARITYLNVDTARVSNDILALEQRINEVCQSAGDIAAYKEFGSPDIRFMYQSQFYVKGIDSLDHRIHLQTGRHTWHPKKAVVSASGDLAHVYGTHTFAEGDVVKEGYYMRIWKKLPGKPWAIVVQVRSLVTALPK
jgi:ketosteroid isomerase-like protein